MFHGAPDIPAYGEGKTEEEAIADLKEALGAYIEAFGIDEATTRLNPPSSLRQLDLELEDRVRAKATAAHGIGDGTFPRRPGKARGSPLCASAGVIT